MICWIHAAALGLAASLVVPAAASAQSLADVAAREKDRRSDQNQKVKSYSEDDLRRAGGPVSSFDTSSDDSTAPADAAAPAEGGSGEGSPQAEGSAPQEKSQDEERAAQEKAWRDKVQKAQQSLNSTAAEMEGIQKSLADNTGNYYTASRTNMLNRLEGLNKRQLAEKDALDALREEGRRSQFRE